MLNIRPLSKSLQAKAISELNEIPERIYEDLKYIKDWLQKQPHLVARTEDQWLLAFLRGYNFSLERVKEKLDAFYTCKTLVTEIYVNRDPFLPELQRLFKLGLFIPLINTEDPAGPVTFLIRNFVYDLSIDKFENIYKYMFMVMDILLYENDNFVVAGHNLVIDMKDVTLAHYLIPAGILEKIMIMYQQNYPFRTKALCLINTSSVSHICFNILRQFMGEKLRNLATQFSENELIKFYEIVPQKSLPNEYGGQAGTLEALTDVWISKIESYSDWFRNDEKYCTKEHLRSGKQKTKSDLFGLECTLRKLNVD